VLQMDRSHVDTVLVAGRPAKRGGKSLVETGALMEDANALVRRFVASGLLTPRHVSASGDLDATAGAPQFRYAGGDSGSGNLRRKDAWSAGSSKIIIITANRWTALAVRQ
jgi:hypothetical protein